MNNTKNELNENINKEKKSSQDIISEKEKNEIEKIKLDREKFEQEKLKKNGKIKNKSFTKALGHAIDGIIGAFKTERNLRIDYLIGLLVLIVSLFFDFTKTEFACICLTIGFVIFSEMINSTVEYMVDLITDKYDVKAKAAKDIAAGGVLLSSTVAVVVAYFLFADKIYVASQNVLSAILNSRLYILFTIFFAVIILGIILKGIFGRKKEEGDIEYIGAFPSIKVALSFGLTTYAYLVTDSLFVGAIALILSFLIVGGKLEREKTHPLYVIMSALIGILIVLIIYQLVLNRAGILSLFIK